MVTSDGEVTLKVENLRACYTSKKGLVKAVNNVSFEVRKGETVGLFGESGAGKTSIALAILGMFDDLSRHHASTAASEENKRLWALKDEARKKGLTSEDLGEDLPGVEGHIWFKGKDLVTLEEKEYRKLRGDEITYVPQGTTKSLNPYSNIEEQTAEVLWAHDEDSELKEWQVMKRLLQTLDLVELGDVDIRKSMKPSQFSVGEDQRVLIAMALISHPALMIADEPTTAVDVGLQNRILDAIQIVRDELDLSMLLISNNQGTIAKTCDRVGVMTAGHIVEFGDTERVLNSPGHPFTRAFIMSNPSMELIRKIKEKGLRIRGIPGKPPDPTETLPGCPFSERCEYAQDICREKLPEYREIEEDYWILCHRYDELPEW
ncbi:MAG: Oligopeptide transport ATP-binding protein OppD [Candidatus Thorarchaeota archaeon AB_25]|nr:MAG: Oligopeptide transport ATP-binding protein OppD [Candidatus Thorarchaeota archaeon AB_25]